MNLIVASFGNLFSGPDLLIILFIVLLLFGAKKLPELARGMGQAVREFNKAKDEFERELTKPANEVTAQPAQGRQEHKPAELPVAQTPASSATTPTAAPAEATHQSQS